MKLQVGDAFPEFALPDGTGNIHTLSQYQGKYVVLYVYPKDDTPGCTVEACAFRDNLELKNLGVAVLGLSPDDAASHQEFSEKYSLPFPLLSDPSLEFLKHIDAWGTKNMYGKVSEGVRRSTFVIDGSGKVVKAWYAVKVEGHDAAVLKAIQDDIKA